MATPRRIARIAAAGALSAALLTAGGLATASTAAAAATPTPSASRSAAGEITLKAAPTEVKAGEKVTFTGRSKGLPIGTKVVLQHKNGSKWTTLHVNTLIKKGSSFSFENTFKDKGKQELRVSAGNWTSPSMTVTVH
ncbi:hypothetical protein [Streptomyces subrutilus]|uniref:Uncharacterized protein n=1 Tax=Streptomyces subrutilus TaxID=36818 RepID=A0A5P2UJR9_9ACTN|nr:hypothetical protein [Streptomyces subrutilus]QEU77931.1 hypothetical protein CP968_06265 [Streptomyces subrutilus]WSJ32911.1 hypothetical protein OG479_28465 [Streptomyces subrutilus]GGZ63435.1 hypothetical protein GCM10010371_23810 [Streptomyces subrutilus]